MIQFKNETLKIPDNMSFQRFNEYNQPGVDYSKQNKVDDWQEFCEIDRFSSDLIKLDLKKNDVFFDIGCGTGKHLYCALNIVKYAFGYDVSHSMLKISSKTLHGKNNYALKQKGFLNIERTDFHLLPNKVFTWGALHHLPDFWKLIALQNLYEILPNNALLNVHDTIWCFKPNDYQLFFERFINEVQIEHGEIIKNHIKQNISEEYATFDFLIEIIFKESGFKILNKDVAKNKCFADYLLIKE